MKSKTNIFLIGPMGAGKTSVGKFIGKKLNKFFYDTDTELEKRMGVNLHWIYDIEGEQGFRQRELDLIESLANLNNIMLATGDGSIECAGIRQILQAKGTVIHLRVSLETQLKRLKYDKRRPILQQDNREEVLINLFKEREALYESIADFAVLTDNRTVKDVSFDILNWL
jgi:shikimate kinase